jgi:O-antigen/teichoic acid export membrane protein
MPLALIAGAAGYFLMPLLLANQTDMVVSTARWYLLLVPLQVLLGLPFYAFRGCNFVGIWNALRVAPTAGWILVLVIGYLSDNHNPSFFAMGNLVMLTLLSVPVLIIARFSLAKPFVPEPSRFREMLRYGLPCFLTTAPQLLNLRLDQMLMAAFFPARLLGLYVAAVAWGGIANPVLHGVAMVLLPRVASSASDEERRTAVTRVSRIGLLLAAAITFSIALPTPWLLPLVFSRSFSPAVPAAVLLVLAGSIAGINIILQEALRGLGKPASAMWSEFSGLVVTGCSLLFLLQPFGIVGAAISSIMGYSTTMIALALHARRSVGGSLRNMLLPTADDARFVWKTLLNSCSRLLSVMFSSAQLQPQKSSAKPPRN